MKTYPEFTWSPKLAYAIGLLVTDGNLSKDGRHIIMRSSDYNLLETFKTCLSIKNVISQSKNDGYAVKPSYRVQFGNVKFYRWLLKIGLFPNKTYTIGEIEIPDEFFEDFIRGHLDGDGSIIAYVDRYNSYFDTKYTNQRLYVKLISVSRPHVEWLQKRINNILDMKGSITSTRLDSKASLWTLKFSKKDSVRLLNWIYYEANLPCLQRKRGIAEEVLKTIQNEKRKTYVKRTNQ